MDLLQQARADIDRVDRQMAALFEERMAAVGQVAEYKKQTGKPIFDPAREALVIERNSAFLQDASLKEDYAAFMRAVMAASRRYQTRLLFGEKVAFQGMRGAFSHITARRLFPESGLVAFPTFAKVIEAVESGEVQAGVLPFENSTTGEVGEVMDLLFTHPDCYVSGWYNLAVQQNLLVLPGTKMEQIRQVYSHQQALDQSSDFLRGRPWQLVPYPNTAAAAAYVSESGDPSKAAIASEETAELYGLTVLERQINSSSVNTTRFAIITRQERLSGDRFGLFFTVTNDTGCLARAVDIISEHGFNMHCLRSRAMKNLPWEYYFYAELDGNLADPAAQTMLQKLGTVCGSLRTLGCYTRVE
ncbi:MAG: bifunctional chorismate mutase/prephenate dehydratase [Pygmaiobacter massiliensis]|nr:bifunctional chorismate mutase/prephenate dehydratase [Pygmaiobacter massiliensis]